MTWPSGKPDLTSKRYFVRITAGEQTFTNVFTVTRNEIAYDVQIRKEGNDNVVHGRGGIRGESYQVPSDDILEENVNYKWWVTAKDLGGNQVMASNAPYGFILNSSGAPNAASHRTATHVSKIEWGERVSIAHNTNSGQAPWFIWQNVGTIVKK